MRIRVNNTFRFTTLHKALHTTIIPYYPSTAILTISSHEVTKANNL